MATDLYSKVLFNDGEGVDPVDFNNAQKFLMAHLQDSTLQYLIGASKAFTIDPTNGLYDPEYAGENGTDAETRFAYCLSPGAAYLRRGSGANVVQITAGTLIQKVGTSAGTDATLIPYTFNGTETWTIAAGDASNPRVDLLQMKLEYIDGNSETRDFEDAVTRAKSTTTPNKRRRVQCTLSVKQGTPAAAPFVPEPDAGFVPVGSVLVGTNYATGTNIVIGEDSSGTNAVLHDQRMPLRVRAHRVDPIAYKLVTAWALSNNNSTVTSSNATNDMYIPCPAGLGRLVGVSIHHTVAFSSPTNQLGRSNGIITTSWVTRNTLGFGNSTPEDIVTMRFFENNMAPSAGPTAQQSATTFIGVPIWSNGRRCLYERQRLATGLGSAPLDTLVMRIQSGVTAHVLGAATFYVAEGI